MRQIWITKYGPPEVLTIRQAPDPGPKPGEVRVFASKERRQLCGHRGPRGLIAL